MVYVICYINIHDLDLCSILCHMHIFTVIIFIFEVCVLSFPKTPWQDPMPQVEPEAAAAAAASSGEARADEEARSSTESCLCSQMFVVC